MNKFLRKIGLLWLMVLSASGAWAQYSGVTIVPAGAMPGDSITIIVNTFETCPRSSINTAATLAGVNTVRLHAGVTIGGANFQNLVSAGTDNPVTRFVPNPNGTATLIKKILPTSYFSAATGITALNFVLNGGPAGDPFARIGKVCATNGDALPGAFGDFYFPFPIPTTIPRLRAQITLPSTDTLMYRLSNFTVRVLAVDTTGQDIDSIRIFRNGTLVQTIRGAAEYTATATDTGLFVYTTTVFGANGQSRAGVNSVRVRVVPEILPSRLYVRIENATDSVIGALAPYSLRITAIDSTGQPLNGVEILRNDRYQGNDVIAPYTWSDFGRPFADTAAFIVRAIGRDGAERLSNVVRVISLVDSRSLTSGVWVIPANADHHRSKPDMPYSRCQWFPVACPIHADKATCGCATRASRPWLPKRSIGSCGCARYQLYERRQWLLDENPDTTLVLLSPKY
jgi:hypothetical protein